ncbi:Nbs-lrr resistance protein [Rhynchospora pubera]|uniref:Nbs-lrr resistance protein n=1 Tax=Rhynchospora pubera TaxID=906938 RepID=A0AAV8GN72_9POAL|nr:Nbs-lrr resistance protein [Rhynchospora pubera]
MLTKLQGENPGDGDEVDFITKLNKLLSKKKYLIVLDDVWSSDQWTRLQKAFPDVHNGSRVLITTRFIDVANKSDAANKPYELRTLSKDESQQLLLKKAFPNQPADKCHHNLLPLINQFSEKCDGWPLALVVLGGILSRKDSMYWDELLSKVDWKSEGKEKECHDIISTSYEDLPFNLKSCFMYLALFPEDYKIKASNLIQLWIVEGLISRDKSTKTMEDIAEDYLEELVQRCMIKVSRKLRSANLENLLTLKGVIACDEWCVKLPHFPRIRKLSFQIDEKVNWEALVNSMSKLEHLNSLRVHVPEDIILVPAFRNYKQLHSLYLTFKWPDNVHCGISLLPPNLAKLTLEWSCLKQDPMPELEKLPNLRVLRLLRSYDGRRLVCSKGGFKCLRQLELETLRNLVELKIEEGGMSNLNQLEISNCRSLNVVPDCHYLTHLRELNLEYMSYEFWSRLERVDQQHKIQHVPSKILKID